MITLDTLRAAAANRTLTLNAAGNEMIENKRFQKFRSFFNIGTARAENQQTLNAIRTAIQNDPRFASLGDSGASTLNRLLGAVRTDRAIKASQIRSVIAQMEEQFNDPVNQRRGLELRIDARIAATPRPAALRLLSDEQYVEIAHYTIANSANGNFSNVDIPARLTELNTHLEHLFAEIGNDQDLRNIFLASTKRLFEHAPSGDLFDAILPKLQAFRADLAAAPQGATPAETATNRRLAAELLATIGKPIDPRHFALLNNLAATLPLPAIAALGPNATPEALCQALNTFCAAIHNTAMPRLEGLRPLEGGDELWPARVFISAMAAMRLPEADRANLYALLTSPAATQVMNLYATLDSTRYMDYGVTTSLLLNGVASCDNRPVPQPVRQEVDYTVFSPKTLTRLCPTDGCFTGNAVGPARRLLRNIPGCIDNPGRTNLLTNEDPGETFQRAVVPTLKSLVAFNAANEMKAALAGNTTQFQRDMHRQQHVRLPDGTMLPNDHAAALDRLTSLLSGDPAARFETAPVALRNRVHLVSALLTQNTEKLVDDGIPMAINGRDTDTPFMFSLDQHGMRNFTLALNPDGGITITYDRHLEIRTAVGLTEEDLYAQPGSFQAAHISITLTGADMDHFLAANWAEADLSDVTERRYNLKGPGDLGNVLYAIPDSCRLNPQIEFGYHIHLNA